MPLHQKVGYIRPNSVDMITPKSTGGGALGTTLFITPREFTNNTYAGPGIYVLDQQGIVGIMAADKTSPWGDYTNAGYRIVTKADGTMDTMVFMEAMSYISVFGERDESKSQATLLNTAKERPVEMRCGPTTAFVRGCAATVGIETRRVHFLNVTEPNYFDDGHVACEAKINGIWKLFDVPTDAAFKDTAGNLLSLAEVISVGVLNTEVVSLAQSRCAASDYSRNPNWTQVFFEMHFRTPVLAQEWRKRIYEVPGMAVGNGIVWGVPSHLSQYASYISSYPGTNGLWTTMPLSDWISTYY